MIATPDSASASVPYWVPYVTAAVGFISAALLDLLRDVRAHRREREAHALTVTREREAREVLRKDQLLERRVTFQRATLLELQEELAKLVRATGEGHHQDVMAHKAGGHWQRQLYNEELNQRMHLANVKTLLLGVRVRDEQVRELTKNLRELSASVARSRTPEAAEHALYEGTLIYEKLNDRIGELLRQLDDEERALTLS
jgi:hypothetical protein